MSNVFNRNFIVLLLGIVSICLSGCSSSPSDSSSSEPIDHQALLSTLTGRTLILGGPFFEQAQVNGPQNDLGEGVSIASIPEGESDIEFDGHMWEFYMSSPSYRVYVRDDDDYDYELTYHFDDNDVLESIDMEGFRDIDDNTEEYLYKTYTPEGLLVYEETEISEEIMPDVFQKETASEGYHLLMEFSGLVTVLEDEEEEMDGEASIVMLSDSDDVLAEFTVFDFFSNTSDDNADFRGQFFLHVGSGRGADPQYVGRIEDHHIVLVRDEQNQVIADESYIYVDLYEKLDSDSDDEDLDFAGRDPIAQIRMVSEDLAVQVHMY